MLYLIVNIICLVSSRTPTITNYVNQMKTTWNAINYDRWQNKPEEFFSRFFNVIINKDEYQYKEIEILKDLPTSFSSQSKWNGCRSIGIIHDQGNCGSCWAVSAASVMSDRLCINQMKDIRISAEDLLSCCGLNCGYGCDGGTIQGAWKYFKSTGIVSGGEYNNFAYCKAYSLPPCNHGFIQSKYNKCDDEIFLISLTPQCKKSCDNQIKNYENEKIRSRTDPYIIIANEEAIMTEIYNYGPVQAIFEVYSDFLNYKSGVYQHVTGEYLGNHAIKIIGWGIENGIKYWEAINSWNEEWGMQGRFKILKGKNHLEIESHITAAEL